jgi:hypothetical protein
MLLHLSKDLARNLVRFWSTIGAKLRNKPTFLAGYLQNTNMLADARVDKTPWDISGSAGSG